MFGAGLYFAEHSTKANQYTHSGQCSRVGGKLKLIFINFYFLFLFFIFIYLFLFYFYLFLFYFYFIFSLYIFYFWLGTPGLNTGNPCKCKRNEENCLLLCRVCLGDPLIEKDYRGNSGPGDFWYQRRSEPSKTNGFIYQSVIGESKENYKKSSLKLREYIIYESKQVYAEYKVFYKRKKK